MWEDDFLVLRILLQILLPFGSVPCSASQVAPPDDAIAEVRYQSLIVASRLAIDQRQATIKSSWR